MKVLAKSLVVVCIGCYCLADFCSGQEDEVSDAAYEAVWVARFGSESEPIEAAELERRCLAVMETLVAARPEWVRRPYFSDVAEVWETCATAKSRDMVDQVLAACHDEVTSGRRHDPRWGQQPVAYAAIWRSASVIWLRLVSADERGLNGKLIDALRMEGRSKVEPVVLREAIKKRGGAVREEFFKALETARVRDDVMLGSYFIGDWSAEGAGPDVAHVLRPTDAEIDTLLKAKMSVAREVKDYAAFARRDHAGALAATLGDVSSDDFLDMERSIENLTRYLKSDQVTAGKKREIVEAIDRRLAALEKVHDADGYMKFRAMGPGYAAYRWEYVPQLLLRTVFRDRGAMAAVKAINASVLERHHTWLGKTLTEFPEAEVEGFEQDMAAYKEAMAEINAAMRSE